MNTVIDDLSNLSTEELILIEGGKAFTEGSSFGEDLGYAIGWLLSAMGKGASAIQG